MPLVLEPNHTFTAVLAADAGKIHPPTFIFRFLSCREWKVITALREQLEQAATGPEIIDLFIRIIRTALTGWNNVLNYDGQSLDYHPDLLEDILTITEAKELMIAALNQLPSEEDKKKFASPLPSSMVESAPSAPALRDAMINPPLPVPSVMSAAESRSPNAP